MIPLNPAEIPPALSHRQAAEYARGLTERQAQPVLIELKRLQVEGKIAGFEMRPDLHAVAVTGASQQAVEQISRLPEVAAVMPDAGEPPTCAVATARAVSEQVLGLSRMAASAAAGVRAAGLAPQATDPSIDVFVQPGGTESDFAAVFGRTTANTLVTMRILRGGQVVATESTTSDGNGNYFFYPSWQTCRYNWSLYPKDVVEVTAHGSTVRTVVAHLRAWVDPVTNTVAGRTDPSRSVEVVLLYHPTSDSCSLDSRSMTVGTDSGGNFSANFSGQVDFDRKAAALVYARDANGNSTYYSFSPYHIGADFYGWYFQGALKPEVDFTATLRRAGNIVSVYSGRTGPDNSYYGWFTDTIRPGDVISVSGGGVNIQYTAVGLTVTLDPVTDRATGTTGPNRLVQADFYKRTQGYVPTACSSDSRCASTTASGTGAFSLNAGLDLMRGDYAYFYVYDAEGNYQYGQRPVPAIVAQLGWDGVSGYWGNPGTSLTVTLKSGGGAVKATRSSVWASSWDGSFETYMWSVISPTDIIEVTDGAVTETMRVGNLTARLDGNTGHLFGNAASGGLVAQLYDFRRDTGYRYLYCREASVAGPYDLTFPGAQVGGQDAAEVWNRGLDGHYTYRYASAFTINAQKGRDYISGYAETPYVPITITLRRSGSPIVVYTTMAFPSGYYYAYLSGGTPVTITPGDTVQVQTGDGDNASLPIPELTANADGANNRVYGKSPAGEPVTVQVRRHYNWGWFSYDRNTTADGSGNYSASFNGLYWSWDCSAVYVGHRCVQVAAYYYNPAGHMVWVEGPDPAPVAPDAYESDDTPATARPYTGIQSHTFHTITDTDWITFTVPQADVDNGVPYRIETFNLGWGMTTVVQVYDASMNLEAEAWAYEDQGHGVSLQWIPSVAGTYYLKVSSWSSGAYCDAVYDLMVLPVRSQIFLPLTMRNY